MNFRTWFDNSVMASIKCGWLDRSNELAKDGQSKRFKAILQVWKKVGLLEDENPFDTMPNVCFFAPSLNTYGQVKQATPPGAVVVYLSPTLELNSQFDVNHTVAHEIAHVSLGHHLVDNPQMKEVAEKYEERPAEKAADELAAKWGFPKRKRGKSRFVRMVVHASLREKAI